MTHQPRLFGDEPLPKHCHHFGPPPSNGVATSDAAAKSVEPVTGEQRWRVLEFVRSRGDHGATDEEIIAALGLNPSAARPRRGELVAAGLVRDSERTRPTSSGRQAIVWIATP